MSTTSTPYDTTLEEPTTDQRTDTRTDADADDADEEPEDTRSKAERLAAFLRQEAKDGETYFKAKFIADDVGLSPKEIGALIVQLQDSVADLEIEKWSYTGATTWRVCRTD
ncbi:DUF7123 family protein [Halorubrum vacuolatum]|uniref:DUF7123 domain-containing protein n=1 Tax=Halorubrum vacuolatum TaxID=63740 RepID=A0A238W4N8_HALVU|nr:hypothetical protein [Halorubrum vacuolatum]SNR41506.1 hypothetical protein SAMN06264855_105120 [Halorubrum vacuolatum]